MNFNSHYVLGAKQLYNLREMVSPYFHPTLLYRIGL